MSCSDIVGYGLATIRVLFRNTLTLFRKIKIGILVLLTSFEMYLNADCFCYCVLVCRFLGVNFKFERFGLLLF